MKMLLKGWLRGKTSAKVGTPAVNKSACTFVRPTSPIEGTAEWNPDRSWGDPIGGSSHCSLGG